MRAAAILVVEDNEEAARMVCDLLTQAGYDAASASDGASTRAALASFRFDLVLCDIELPDTSGVELAEQIMSAHDVPVVMVTGLDDPDLARTVIDLGAYGYVIKPFNPNEVLIHVWNGLRRHRLEIETRAAREQLAETLRERTTHLWEVLTEAERMDFTHQEAFEDMVRRLATATALRDEETGEHIDRMSRYVELLATKAGLGTARARLLSLAGRMHDVGKIALPDRILRKRTSLTAAEYELVKQHAEVGHRLLAGTPSEILGVAATIAWTHHERWDGAGYPRGLCGEAIPLEGRIAAIADAFDAITSRRVYRRALPLPLAVAELREGRGGQFDGDLVDLFIGSIGEAAAIMGAYEEGTGAAS